MAAVKSGISQTRTGGVHSLTLRFASKIGRKAHERAILLPRKGFFVHSHIDSGGNLAFLSEICSRNRSQPLTGIETTPAGREGVVQKIGRNRSQPLMGIETSEQWGSLLSCIAFTMRACSRRTFFSLGWRFSPAGLRGVSEAALVIVAPLVGLSSQMR